MRYCVIVFGLLVAAVMLSCAGGSRIVPAVEESPAGDDTSRVFIFAETPFLNVDSDMLGRQFNQQQLPMLMKEIDSATAEDAVYQILTDSLLGVDAANFDLTTEPLLYTQYIEQLNARVMRLLYQKEITERIEIADSVVRQLYEANKESFKIQDQFRARHIVISAFGLRKLDSALYREYTDEQMDSIARARVVELRERILDGESFDTLAMMYSEDPGSAAAGGDLGYFELSRMVAPFDSTVEHTPIGEVSGVIKTLYGWHVLKVEDFATEHYSPYDSVYNQLHHQLMQNRMQIRAQEYVDSVIDIGSVRIDTASLMVDDTLHGEDDVLAIVNPDDTLYGCDTLRFSDYSDNVYRYRRARQIVDTIALSVENKVELLEFAAIRGHLMRQARIHGYDKDPEIEDWAKGIILRYSVATLRKQIIDDGYESTEEEERAYYDAHIDEYRVERPIYVQHIVFADSNLAEHVRDQVSSGMDFMEMAQQYYPGDEDIRQSAADLGYVGSQDMPPAFWRTANMTAVGEISRPVKTEYGYHIIKVVEKTHNKTFEVAKYTIKNTLKKMHKEKLRREFVESRIGGSPVFHWDKVKDLYRILPPKPSYLTTPNMFQ